MFPGFVDTAHAVEPPLGQVAPIGGVVTLIAAGGPGE